MSSAILIDQDEHHPNYLDDQESAFYVLLYYLLLYTKHNQLRKLRNIMKIFDVPSDDTGHIIGIYKTNFLRERVNDLVFDDNPLLTNLVQELALMFHVRYERRPDEMLLEFYKSETGAKSSQNTIIRQQKLDKYLWIESMQECLKDRSRWPENDVACLNKYERRWSSSDLVRVFNGPFLFIIFWFSNEKFGTVGTYSGAEFWRTDEQELPT